MKLSFWIISFVIVAQGLFAEEHKLSVTGSSSVFKPADQLTMVLGAETFDKESKKAVTDNALKMNALRDSLRDLGLTGKEMQTANFMLLPQMTPAPKNPQEDWKAAIAGYQVRNTLEIRTNQLELAGQIIDSAAQVGSNYIQQIVFSLQDEEEAKVEAITKAFNQARRYAQALAEDAGIRLGDIIDLSITHSYVMKRSFNALQLAADAETSIAPGDVEISASVSASFVIEKETSQ
jgi:uncharacterized protein